MPRPASQAVPNPFPLSEGGWSMVPLPKQPLRVHLLHASQVQTFPASMSYGIHSHPVFHFVLVTHGCGSFFVENARIPVRSGDLVLIDPNVPHSFKALPDEDTAYSQATLRFFTRSGRVWTGTWRELLHGLNRLAPGEEIPTQVSSAMFTLMTECIGRMVRAFSDRRGALLVDIEVHELLALLSRAVVEHASATPSNSAVARVYDAILQAGLAPVDLAELARLVGRNANYVSRAFKARFGLAPVAFQNRRRMEAARRLLETTDYPLKQIAEMTGFQSTQSFWRYFQRHEGCSPGSLRGRSAAKGAERSQEIRGNAHARPSGGARH